MKNTTKNIVIPRDAPKVTKIDQGDTRSKTFGGPSDIV
jgi:hypothetical protein